MRWSETLAPTRMHRVAVVAPDELLRDVLVLVADEGVCDIDELRQNPPSLAADALQRMLSHQQGRSTTAAATTGSISPVLVPDAPDIGALESNARYRELAGEAEMDRIRGQALSSHSVAAVAGWCPSSAMAGLTDRLRSVGGAVVPLAEPPGSAPPTLLPQTGASGAFQPLVDTYGTVPYRDVNPSVLAGVAYAVMFGMMFGDLGHGLLLVAAGLLLRAGHPRALSHLSRLAPFLMTAGAASAAFGLAYGEAFGPTGIVPALWLKPLDHPTTLLAVAIAIGGALLAVSYGFGITNRWREEGVAGAALALSGIAGAALYLGLAVTALGLYIHVATAEVFGAVLALSGLALGFLGCLSKAGGRAVGAVQATIETFDATVRIGSNTISFARLAAFGLTHAALGYIIWKGTLALWHQGVPFWLPAVLIFIAGNAAAFALEGLVAAVQALRLEYYEMFSRIFVREGRRYRPWRIPTATLKEDECSPG